MSYQSCKLRIHFLQYNNTLTLYSGVEGQIVHFPVVLAEENSCTVNNYRFDDLPTAVSFYCDNRLAGVFLQPPVRPVLHAHLFLHLFTLSSSFALCRLLLLSRSLIFQELVLLCTLCSFLSPSQQCQPLQATIIIYSNRSNSQPHLRNTTNSFTARALERMG